MLDRAAGRVRDDVAETAWPACWRTGVAGQSVEDAAHALVLSAGTVCQYRSREIGHFENKTSDYSGGAQRW